MLDQGCAVPTRTKNVFMPRLVSILTAGALVATPMQAAVARPRQMKGSFTAAAKPLPVAWPVTDEGCMQGIEDVHRVTKTLTARFSGWLQVSANFSGDWDLALFDPEGRRAAMSEHQWSTLEEGEQLDYYLHKGQSVDIAVCNNASGSDAAVEYVLTSGGSWKVKPGSKRIEHETKLKYISPAIATRDRYAFCISGFGVGCPGTDAVRSNDRFVSVEVRDDAGLDVSAGIVQYNGSTDLGNDLLCTKTRKPVPLKPGVDWVSVSIYLGPCEDGRPALGTRGDVTVTFSNHR